MTNRDFENVVRETIAELPEIFRAQLDNVDIVIEAQPEEGLGIDPQTLLLGLYQGIPKTKRFSYFALPDKITLFTEPILQISRDTTETKRIIRSTVLHELGHHFGLSDEELTRIEKK